MTYREYDAATGAVIERPMTPEEVAEREASKPVLEAPSPFLPLKPYQFWGAVRATGHEIDLLAWVDAIADPVQKGIASAMLEFSLEFRRDHPLIEAARVHLEMTEQELNDLWLWGLTL